MHCNAMQQEFTLNTDVNKDVMFEFMNKTVLCIWFTGAKQWAKIGCDFVFRRNVEPV